jgi:hypothetical protein
MFQRNIYFYAFYYYAQLNARNEIINLISITAQIFDDSILSVTHTARVPNKKLDRHKRYILAVMFFFVRLSVKS